MPARPQRAARRVGDRTGTGGGERPPVSGAARAPGSTAPVVVVLSGPREARSTLPAAGGAITGGCGPTSLHASTDVAAAATLRDWAFCEGIGASVEVALPRSPTHCPSAPVAAAGLSWKQRQR